MILHIKVCEQFAGFYAFQAGSDRRYQMRFEVSERIRTNKGQDELLAALEEQLRKISESVQRSGPSIEAKSIEASFGSINRSDTTVVSLKKTEDGWLVLADVHYRPSVAFWIILIITLFTYVFWLLPIAFYLLQKNTVRTAIVECFQRIRNEFDKPNSSGVNGAVSSLEDLERLGALRDKGLLTEAEFQEKKRKMLGL